MRAFYGVIHRQGDTPEVVGVQAAACAIVAHVVTTDD